MGFTWDVVRSSIKRELVSLETGKFDLRSVML